MPTPPESEGAPKPAVTPAEALRARLRAVAEAEQSKREQEPPAPVAAPPSTGSSGLWEAPRPQVEEPISPFLIPINEEPLRPHERVEVAKVKPAAELPKARVVAMPAEEPKPEPEQDRVSLAAHVETLLTLLRTDEIDEAIAMQDTPTHDAPDATVRTRWHLTKELIGVAKSLPPRVLQVIATAIGRDNLEGAKGELTLFRQQNPGPAKEADIVLRTRAKSIQRGIAGALYVEPPVYQPPPAFTPNYESPKSSSGANFWWIGIVVVLGIIRIAVRTSSHNSYDYDYSYTPSYNYSSSYDDYAKTQALLDQIEKERQAAAVAMPAIVPASPYEEPADFDKNASQEQLVDEIERSLFVLRENGWLTDAQSEKMTDFWVTSPYYTLCTDARTAMKGWEKLKMSDELPLAKRHIKAVRTRLDTLCPATKKKKAAAKKPKPVEMELSDSPPN